MLNICWTFFENFLVIGTPVLLIIISGIEEKLNRRKKQKEVLKRVRGNSTVKSKK